MTDTSSSFDVLDTLPTGRVAIEASAGTGKTFTLTALATRYLAEWDMAPSELLVVTFTRAATAELRSRIRDQLVTTATALRTDVDGPEIDRLSRHIGAQHRPARRSRLDRAVSEFDTTAVSTMHSFAAHVRSTIALSSAVDADARLATDDNRLVRAACADVLAAASEGRIPVEELPSLGELVRATELAIGGAHLVLQPVPGTPNAPPASLRLRQLTIQAAANLSDRRVRAGTISYDDVLTQLRDALVDGVAPSALIALRNRFNVVLIDEFQDTDRVQWEIFSTLFGHGGDGRALVVVGDPKQAIYRFRGADVGVYLEAVDPATGVHRHTLTTNWRSDGAVLRAHNLLFSGATFGDTAIRYTDVEAAPHHQGRRLGSADGEPFAAVDIRVPRGSELPRKGNLPDTGKTARIIERDVVRHVRNLLDRARIPTGSDDPVERPLRPSDIAVLVASRAHGISMQSALRRQGVPAVVATAGNVLSSWAADQVRLLLSAMERPSDLRRVRAYALSWFESWAPVTVAGATDDQFRALQDRLADWSARLAERTVAEVLADVWTATGVKAHVLGRFDGDRHVTDLDHLAEYLHASGSGGMSGASGLLAVLDAPPDEEADADVDGSLVARRIESEAQAVQIMTIWAAKGLEFPVVCLPMLWRRGRATSDVVYADPETRMRTADLARGQGWPDEETAKSRVARSRAEEAGERLRLLYVALTRAQHHTAVWWANSRGGSAGALSTLLFARDPETGRVDPGRFAAGECDIPDEDAVPEFLGVLERQSDRTITVSVVEDRPAAGRWIDTVETPPTDRLVITTFAGGRPTNVERWSFSAITQRAAEIGHDPYDESGSDRGADDEDGRSESATSGGVGPDGSAAPGESDDGYEPGALGDLVAGTAFGTFVHAVLERVDFASGDLDAELLEVVRGLPGGPRLDVDRSGSGHTDGVQRLVRGLRDAIHSPLGPLFADRCLADLSRSDRLDEMSFDLHVGGGGRVPTAADIGRLVSGHLPDDHPLAAWAAELAGGAIDARLEGYLTGSIDLVARVGIDGEAARFVVADYKTNQLVRRGRVPERADYGPVRLAEAMAEHHYPLQALLYAVALHRYLRWKLPDDDAPTRVAGAAYLFVRGMTGPDVVRTDGQPHGVFTWAMPPQLVVDLSDVLAGRVGAGV